MSSRPTQKGYAEGTQVHHRGSIWSRGRPDHAEGGMNGGWGTVLRSVAQGDGSFEYEVLIDRGLAGDACKDGGETSWWGSHHVDEALSPAEPA